MQYWNQRRCYLRYSKVMTTRCSGHTLDLYGRMCLAFDHFDICVHLPSEFVCLKGTFNVRDGSETNTYDVWINASALMENVLHCFWEHSNEPYSLHQFRQFASTWWINLKQSIKSNTSIVKKLNLNSISLMYVTIDSGSTLVAVNYQTIGFSVLLFIVIRFEMRRN